ncbi:unnamed protein product [Cylicocyclus nassatus]|uniref:SCP domain-containing protein n=1 Tax=Cylicocyclus nassatus TaxID=53992 RepID=A0AA36M7A9_CYLNA|nr:unnamed protein product [Cylicocyclus nassatus]
MQQLLCTASLLAAIVPLSLARQCTYSDSSAGLADDKQTASLKVINDLREKLAKGEQQNGMKDDDSTPGDPLPAAKQIDPLTWSCTLEEEARDAVSTCPYDDPPATGKFGFFTYTYESGPDDHLDGMLKLWLDDINYVAISTSAIGEEDVKFDGNDDLKTYANFMREDINEIGCIETLCNIFGHTVNRTVIYCFTNQDSLATNGTIYHLRGTTTTTTTTTITTTTTTTTTAAPTKTTTTTAATTTTPAATTTTKSATTCTGLATKTAGTTSCIPRRKTTCAPSAPQSPAEFPPASAGPNDRCPKNTGMDDTLRTKFLDMHNYRRAELAKGNIVKRNMNYLPQSSDMQRMRYNCALEKEVIDYVSTCPLSKSAELTRPDVGENFIRVPQEGLATYLLAVEKAVTSWWKVIRTEEGPGLQVYFRQKHAGTPIESFTQMGWSTSRKLGCAIAKCGSDYVAVCRYSPRGNYVEQVIYRKGSPCTACAAGSWCTKNALCTLE